MTTNIQLGMSSALSAVGGYTGNLDKQYKKAELVDMILGLAFFVRNLPQGNDLFRNAAKLIKASPSKGGGFDNAKAAIGSAFTVNDEASIWSDSERAVSTLASEAAHVSPPTQVDGDGTNPNTGGSNSSCGAAAAGDSEASAKGVPSTGTRQKACKTAYGGFNCQESTCQHWHPPTYCHDSSCYPRRRAECTDWHPRNWSHAARGNGVRGGSGRPSTKSSGKSGHKSGNNKKNSTAKNPSYVVKKLESELTKTKAELSSQRIMGKTFRDALLASQMAPSPRHQHAHAANTSSTPAATAASVPVLPTELVEILSSLAKALAAAGITSQ